MPENKNIRVRIVEDIGRPLGTRIVFHVYDLETGKRLDSNFDGFDNRPEAAKAAQKLYGNSVEIIGDDEVEEGTIDYPDSQYHKTLAEQEAVAKLLNQ
jgi:hypothetical protein